MVGQRRLLAPPPGGQGPPASPSLGRIQTGRFGPVALPHYFLQAAGRFFQVKERGSSLTQELRGGAVSLCCPVLQAMPPGPCAAPI